METLFRLTIESNGNIIIAILAFPSIAAAVAFFCRAVQTAKMMDGIEVSGKTIDGPELQ